MKNFIYFIALILFPSSMYAQNWVLQHPAHFPRQHTGVYAFDSLRALTIGNGPPLLTFDAGKSWTFAKIDSPRGNTFRSLFFRDSLHGWIGGTFMSLYHTSDGGKTWQKQHLDSIFANGFTYIFFSDNRHGWAISDTVSNSKNKLWRTTDGGQNWTLTYSDRVNHIKSIHFDDSLNGWASAASLDNDSANALLTTTDGGLSWKSNNMPPEVKGKPWEIMRHPVSNSLFLMTNKDIYRSKDSGRSWLPSNINNGSTNTEGMNFWNNCGIGVFHSRLFKTSDFGETWKEIVFTDSLVKKSLSNSFTKAAFGKDGSIWIANKNLSNSNILHSIDTGNSWNNLLKDISSINDIEFTDELNGFAICGNNTLLYTVNGGKSWQSRYVNDSTVYNDIFFVDNNYGLLSKRKGQSFAFCRTENGGENWETVYQDTVLGIQRMHFFSKNSGIAAFRGHNNETGIAITSDSGRSWQVKYQTSKENIVDINFTDSKNGWAFAWGLQDLEHYLLKTSDGGQSWINILLPFSKDVKSIYCRSVEMRDSVKIWLCGQTITYQGRNKGFLFYTSDGGKNWIDRADTNSSIFQGVPITDIKFVDDQRGIMISNIIYETNDGGFSWYEAPSEISITTSAGRVAQAGKKLWVAGGGGLILHKSFDITSVDAVERMYAFSAYTAYPNPSNGKLSLRINIADPPDEIIGIYNIHGERVGFISPSGFVSDGAGGWKVDIDLRGLPQGYYVINSSYGEAKLIIQR